MRLLCGNGLVLEMAGGSVPVDVRRPEARLPAGHAVDRYSPALILLWTITESRRLRASAIS